MAEADSWSKWTTGSAVAIDYVLRVPAIVLRFRERLAARSLRFGDLGPCFTEDLETPKPTFIENTHVRRIAVIELFENVTHR